MQKFVWALLATMVVVCSTASAQTKSDPQANKFIQAFAAAMNSRNVDKGVALMTPDATLVDPFGKASTGKEAQRNFFELAFKLYPNATFALKPAASHTSGNMMWIVANAVWTPTGNTAGPIPLEAHAAYVLARRGGTWKLQMLLVGFNGQPPASH
jgi:ketosteroid isomerase-like protein